MSAQEAAKTMRDDINQAIEGLGAGESLEETPQEVLTSEEDKGGEETPTSEDENLSSEEKSDAKENESPAPDNDDEEGKSSASPSDGAGDSSQDTKPDEDKPAEGKAPTDSLKAPVSWTPQEREQWSKVPRPLQDRILAREQEIERTIADTRAARTLHDNFNGIVQSYAPVLAAEGVQNPLQAVESLFGAVARLRMGTPMQKAQEVQYIIQQYGIDIPTLDHVLSTGQSAVGNGQPADPNLAHINQVLDQKLGPVQQFMNTVQQNHQHAQQTERVNAENQVSAFSETAEFISDVREDMADLIDLAAQRGKVMTLQQAYDLACQQNPEIKKVLDDRAEAERLAKASENLQDKKHAAGSISGKKGGSGGSPVAASLRDTIAQAWEEQENQ